ncbi:sensor histidine kinase [Anoxynatronum buryatiense]|uniref:histidine kinase n=1 Tax=Anoxynatronum buryatiense TaxID=489973 RepID=A0AA45WWE0_9CLOT|nr:ATP-binding protein [Anoxynatronum buryatiense]SMP58692.1 two-component system, OmpR family, sensor histidine kinase VicK [Anoxynatronum buryatiense]
MFKSIRIKIITIYFLLIFMAMVIVGLFMIRQFENYHLGVERNNIVSISGSVATTLQSIDWQNQPQETQENLNLYERVGMEIYVIERGSRFTIAASTNLTYLNENATHILEPDLILGALNGHDMEKDVLAGTQGISSKNMAFPLYDEDNRINGVVYVRKDLGDIYQTLDQSKFIMLRSTLVALGITILLGYFIASSITGPIRDVTVKASKMARGDFDQVVEVKSSDEIGQLASMFNYLTARLKTLLQEVSSEKQKLDTILTDMADGVIATTIEGTLIHINSRALAMLSLTREEAENKTFDQLFQPINQPLSLKVLQEEHRDFSGVEVLDMPDGTKLRASYAPYRSEAGEAEGMVLLLQDITEHEKLEKMRKEFVANVSHELKTPLTTIKSYTETMLEGSIDDPAMEQRFLKVINDEADRMTRLVRELLQLSNLDYQQMKWEPQPVNLRALMEKVLRNLDQPLQQKQHQVTYDPPEQPLITFGDQDAIEQVILNLFSNAIKYTPDGGNLHLYLEREQAAISLTIQDNGIGIPSQDLPRVFERFYRVDKARSREMGGTGLGLSIARQIVEAHGGSIHLYSREGKGTRVVMRLPLYSGEETSEKEAVAQPS